MKRVIRAWIWSKSRHETGYSVLSRSKIQVSISLKGRPPAAGIEIALAGTDQGSRTRGVGKQLEEDGVRHPPVEDYRRLDPSVERLEAGLDLGNHAARDDALGDQPPCALHGDFRDQPLVCVEHPSNIGQQ